MKSKVGRALLVGIATCILSIAAFATVYGVDYYRFESESYGARHGSPSLVDSRSGLSPSVGDVLRPSKLPEGTSVQSTEDSSRALAKGRDHSPGVLFRPSTMLILFLTLLALVGLRRDPSS